MLLYFTLSLIIVFLGRLLTALIINISFFGSTYKRSYTKGKIYKSYRT